MKPARFQINPSCNACNLCSFAHPKSICLNGLNTDVKRKLAVFTDHPDYFANNARRPYAMDSRKILDWMFARMSVNPEQVAYEYTLRCYPGENLPSTKAGRSVVIAECAEYRFDAIKRIRPSALVGLGQVTLEAFTGNAKLGDSAGRKFRCWEGAVRLYCEDIWIGYSLTGILGQNVTETPNVFRVLFRAAQDAGLKPKINPRVPPFQWKNLI